MDELRSITDKPIDFNLSHKLCGQCHQNQFKDWSGGAHGKQIGGWLGGNFGEFPDIKLDNFLNFQKGAGRPH